MKITITGANSYLGSFVAEHFLQNSSHELILIHSQRANEKIFLQDSRVKNIKADLNINFDKSLCDALLASDKVFHFAWIRGKNKEEVKLQNNNIIDRLFHAIDNPAKLFFVSSVSGTPNTKSEYGKDKYDSLISVIKRGAKVIILGLVMENKPTLGPYLMLIKIAKKIPISFRVGKDEPWVFPISKSTFAEAMLHAVDTDYAQNKFAFFQEPVLFNLFMGEIEKKHPRKRLKITVSAGFLLGLASFAKKIPFFPTKICDQILTFFYKDSDFLLADDIYQYKFLKK